MITTSHIIQPSPTTSPINSPITQPNPQYPQITHNKYPRTWQTTAPGLIRPPQTTPPPIRRTRPPRPPPGNCSSATPRASTTPGSTRLFPPRGSEARPPLRVIQRTRILGGAGAYRTSSRTHSSSSRARPGLVLVWGVLEVGRSRAPRLCPPPRKLSSCPPPPTSALCTPKVQPGGGEESELASDPEHTPTKANPPPQRTAATRTGAPFTPPTWAP